MKRMTHNIPLVGAFRLSLVPDRLYGLLDGVEVQIRKHRRGHFRWTVHKNQQVQYPEILGRGTTRYEAIEEARKTLEAS